MKFLVTAGPTREFFDPIRFITNRSTGKMGYAIAEAATVAGHDVCLVSGPVSLSAPAGVDLVKVETAREMFAAVREHISWCDALIMAAAVADWRPADRSPVKIKKDQLVTSIRLERTDDILSSVMEMKQSRIFVGFAAETGPVESEARRKLVEKGLDMIVANDVTRADAGFEVDTNVVTFIATDGTCEDFPVMAKAEVGRKIVEWVEGRAGARART